VVLPRHPLYGREVVVLSRWRETNVTVCCIVVLPENPTFRYRLRERWLESMPPSMPAPTEPQAVRLPLVVLDTLTQRLLGLQRAECAYAQPDLVSSCSSSDLDATSTASPAVFDRPVGVPAAPDRSGSDE
jgi:hypothetical protein